MKSKRESRSDLHDKKIDALIRVVQGLMDENAYLKDLSVGTFETIKLMEGYEEAIEKLKVQMAGNASQIEEAVASGEISK